MESLKIQLLGGRGSKSKLGVGGIKSNNLIQKKSEVKGGRINEKIFKDLNEWEEAIRYSSVEILVACDNEGNPVYAFSSGNDIEVRPPDYRYYELESHIVTHNHPNDTTFSIDDIKTMINYDFSEIRAVVSDGIFVFKKTNKVDLFILYDIDLSAEKYVKDFEKAKEDLEYQFNLGKLTVDDFMKKQVSKHREIFGDYYTKLAENYGYKYYFIKK